jgi:hypothetical protein
VGVGQVFPYLQISYFLIVHRWLLLVVLTTAKRMKKKKTQQQQDNDLLFSFCLEIRCKLHSIITKTREKGYNYLQ